VTARGEIGVFGRGDYHHVPTDEPSVFAYRRHLDDVGTVVCVVNVSPEPLTVQVEGLDPGGRTLCGAQDARVAFGAHGGVGNVMLPPFGWLWCEGVV
jgi:hypothetical protein